MYRYTAGNPKYAAGVNINIKHKYKNEDNKHKLSNVFVVLLKQDLRDES